MEKKWGIIVCPTDRLDKPYQPTHDVLDHGACSKCPLLADRVIRAWNY